MNNSQDEIKLVIPKGCDNAPRKQIMIDFTVAILKGQMDIIEAYADQSIVWQQLKDKIIIDGQDALFEYLQNKNTNTVIQLEIHQVITHGKYASINGIISFEDSRQIEFCDVYTFSNTAKSGKVKEIKSYQID